MASRKDLRHPTETYTTTAINQTPRAWEESDHFFFPLTTHGCPYPILISLAAEAKADSSPLVEVPAILITLS